MPTFSARVHRKTTELARVYQIMERYASGAPATYSNVGPFEISMVAHLVSAAQDNHRLRRRIISVPDVTMLEPNVTIATVSLGRNDISRPSAREHERQGFALRWTRSGTGECITVVNENSVTAFNQQNWQDLRLEALGRALEYNPHIVCFGEYDYLPNYLPVDLDPPLREDKKRRVIEEIETRAKGFDAKIEALINGKAHPVFLFAGSHHACRTRGGITDFRNVGRLFQNTALLDRERTSAREHLKRGAATKIGEVLSANRDIVMDYYLTKIGKVGVLICSNVHDPTIILEVLGIANCMLLTGWILSWCPRTTRAPS